MLAAGETVTATIVTPAPRDGFGDPVGSPEPEATVDGCLFAPGASAEANEAANQVDSDAVLYMPNTAAAATVTAPCRIRVGGLLHEVVGTPAAWGTFGIAVTLRRVTG